MQGAINMPKNKNAINIKNLIISRIEEVKQVKKNNQQKNETFQAHAKETRDRISNFADQFNDI